MQATHVTCEPAILYFGTPVVLLSTINADGSYNLAPMSSVFWLGWRCMLGLDASSKTVENMMRNGECVLNLPSASLAAAVNRLARTTGSNPPPHHKAARGYVYAPDKFAIAGLTPVPSQTVAAPRVLECSVQLEAIVVARHSMAADNTALRGKTIAFEVRIQRVHLDPGIMMKGEADRVDPDKWRPLIMSFQKYYGLAPDQVQTSALALIPERLYRSPDVDKARHAAIS